MRRKERWILPLGFGGLILNAVAILAGWNGVVSLGSLLTGAGGALSMLECHRTGILSTNWGVVRRADCRACFRFQLGWWWTALVLWTLGGVLFGLGVLPLR